MITIDKNDNEKHTKQSCNSLFIKYFFDLYIIDISFYKNKS